MEFPRLQSGRRVNKRFNYVPVYYDEDMEDLEKRVKTSKVVHHNVTEQKDQKTVEQNIRDGFRQRATIYQTNYNEELRKSKLRTVAIALVLGVIVYYVFSSNLIDRLLLYFTNG